MIVGSFLIFSKLKDSLLQSEVTRIEFEILANKSRIIDSILPAIILKEQSESLSPLLNKLKVNDVTQAEIVQTQNICGKSDYCIKLRDTEITSYLKILDPFGRAHFLKRTHQALSLTPIQSFHDNIILYITSIPILIFLLFLVLIFLFSKFIEAPILEIGTGNLETKRVLEFNEIERLKAFVSDLLQKSITNAVEKRNQEIYRQVAHDIRSPLAALEIVMEDIKNLPEGSRELTLHAINRIQDIANNLSKKNIESKQNNTSRSLISVNVSNIINEKSIEYQNLNTIQICYTDMTSKRNFVDIGESDFSRVISNIINNSIEALNNHGRLDISLSEAFSVIELKFNDNGHGFPATFLKGPITQGNSIGKKNGQGLGLYHAHETISKLGGSLELNNPPQGGAQVTITLPKAKAPNWFKAQIQISQFEKVIVVDDDKSIHEVWSKLISESALNPIVLDLYNIHDFENIINQQDEKTVVFLDYDLRQNKTGIDLIKEFSLINIVLVTSNYDTENVVNFCNENNIQLVPKQIVSFFDLV